MTQETQEVLMPYWHTPEFHKALEQVPFWQQDVAGVWVLSQWENYYKKVQGQLVYAMVPENLSIPDKWEPLAEDHPHYQKVASMFAAKEI